MTAKEDHQHATQQAAAAIESRQHDLQTRQHELATLLDEAFKDLQTAEALLRDLDADSRPLGLLRRAKGAAAVNESLRLIGSVSTTLRSAISRGSASSRE